MSFDPINAMTVGPVGPTHDLLRPQAPPHSPAAARFADVLRQAATIDTVPGSPPAGVLRQVDDAARHYERLRENGRELRFDWNKDEQRLRIAVRDLDGRLLREIPPSAALDAMAGGPLRVGPGEVL